MVHNAQAAVIVNSVDVIIDLIWLQVRNKLLPARRKAEAGQGTTWRGLPQEDLQARLAASSARRRAMTQTMPKDQWDLEKK